MKNVLKNILICISIIYLLISLVYNIFFIQIAKETLKTNINAQGLMLEGNVTTYEFEDIQKEYTRGGLRQGYENLEILTISAVIGTILGLFISLKENSKVKYVLYFIFGNILYNSIWLVIITAITNNYLETTENGNWFYYLYKSYTSVFENNMFIKTFLSYILIYATILIGNIINNKKKVEELNRSLKGEKK